MLTYVPFLGWISSELVIAFATLTLSIGGWGAKVCYGKYTDKRDTEKIYHWLFQNTGRDADFYDMSSKAIASAVCLPVERTRNLCALHPKIKPSTGRLEDSWWVHEYESVYEYRGLRVL